MSGIVFDASEHYRVILMKKFHFVADFCGVSVLGLKIAKSTFMTILEKTVDASKVMDHGVTLEAVLSEEDKKYLEKEFNGFMVRKALNKIGIKVSFVELTEEEAV